MKSLNRISLGQHYPVASPVHRLDARVKIIAALAMIAAAFAAGRAAGVVILFLFALAVIYLAKLPPLQVLSALRSVWILLLITALAQLLFSPGRELWRWGPLVITNTGLENGALYTLRLAMAVILICLLTMTSSSVDILNALESLLSPLRLLRFPIRDTAMVLAIALRFLPALLSRAGEISRMQEARGADFSGGRLLRRARSLLPLFVPLFVSCFRDADELGTALASRGYREGRGRTRYRNASLGAADALALAMVAAVIVLSLRLP